MRHSALRKKILEYIDQVDEDFLVIVHNLLQHEVSSTEFDMSEEDKRVTNQRRTEMRNGLVKGVPHKKVISNLRARVRNSK